jgi:hypothetical protein
MNAFHDTGANSGIGGRSEARTGTRLRMGDLLDDSERKANLRG